MLRGVTPDKIEKRLKMLIYGPAGVGKTIAAIQFPAPYLIDTERGAENTQYLELISENNGVIFQTDDIDEIIQELKTLICVDHPYKTIIIDPLTVVYNKLVDEEALRPANDGKDPTAFGRHYVAANRKVKHLLNLLLRVDMNVIITSHSKTIYGERMESLGNTYDGYKKLDYLFDLVIEVEIRGGERIAKVKKTRMKSFPAEDNFKFSYQEINKRYGKEILERKSEAKVFASEDNIRELTRLIILLKVPVDVTNKWLSKSNSVSFDEMEQEHMEKCIKLLKDKAEKTKPTKPLGEKK